jgi:hypothetical protein
MNAEGRVMELAWRRWAPRSVGVRWLCAAACAVLPGVASAAAPSSPSLAVLRRLETVQSDLNSLLAGIGASPADDCARLTARARASLTHDIHGADGLFHLVLALCPKSSYSAALLLEAARSDALIGASENAARVFLQASELATRSHELAPAFEGYVQMAERLARVDALPPLTDYMLAVGQKGAVDEAGTETVYRLGRALMRQKDPRAANVLLQIPPGTAAHRRAFYVLGAARLRDGDLTGARTLFLAAAESPTRDDLPPEEKARDDQVRELAWLATGRLAFEEADSAAGYFAYQQVLVTSPQFASAFVELGWLAMENGNEPVAMAVFEPLIQLDAAGEAGRRAGLLKGYMLLTRKQYDLAREHYESVAKTYVTALSTFDRAVAKLDDPAELARDCATRTAASRDPVMLPVVQRLEVEAARRLETRLGTVSNERVAAASQLEVAEGMLQNRGTNLPLKELADARQRARALLEILGGISVELERTASRATWQAGLAPVPVPGCCAEPADRLRKTRASLEALATVLESREAATRAALTSLRDRFRAAVADHQRSYQELAPAVRAQQQALVRQGIAAVRHELHRMAMEGDAGVLEAIWRFKEDHREQIKAQELERKRRLEEMELKYLEELAAATDPEDDLPPE